MKNIILFAVCLLSIGNFAQEKTIKTTTFTVIGICDDCKERIENGADIKGVKICEWNPDTKIAKVTYDESKVSLDKIQKAISNKGYDVGPYKGDNEAYAKLPKCCQYRDPANKELKH